MKKFLPVLLLSALLLSALLLSALLLAGCAAPGAVGPSGTGTPPEGSVPESVSPEETAPAAGIPFGEGQLYAAAYLGYLEPEALAGYVNRFLGGEDPPTHYLSAGEFYLIIPRYEGMELALSRVDFDTSEPVLLYHDPDCGPFVVQCNASDIFADCVIRLTHGEETAEFSPFVSLKDGSVQLGERGLDLSALPG